MGNVWGGSLNTPTPIVASPSGDVTCTADTAVTCVTSGAIATPTPGNYIPLIQGLLTILQGATKPTALTVKFILGAGSAVDTFTVEPGLLSNNGELQIPVLLLGASSGSAWASSGQTINVQVTAAGQAVTCKQVGSRLLFSLLRGADA